MKKEEYIIIKKEINTIIHDNPNIETLQISEKSHVDIPIVLAAVSELIEEGKAVKVENGGHNDGKR